MHVDMNISHMAIQEGQRIIRTMLFAVIFIKNAQCRINCYASDCTLDTYTPTFALVYVTIIRDKK